MKYLATLLFILIMQQTLFSQSGTVNRRSAVMNENRISTVFGNWGVIGQPGNLRPRGAWPYPVNGYIGDFSILIGARIHFSNSLNFASVIDCPVERPSMGGYDQNLNGTRRAFEPLNLGPNNLAFNNDPSTWPAGWTGWPFLNQADLEAYFEMDDNNDEEFNYAQFNTWNIQFKPDSTDPTRNGLGLKIETRYRQFDGGGLEDVFLMEHNLINEGTTTYRQMVFGGLMGTYVGVTGGDDSPQEYDDDAAFFNIEDNYTFFWDYPMNNNRNPFWIGTPGFAALAFLQSPGNPYDGIDNDRDNASAPGSSAPYFTAADFDGHILQAGEQIILIDENFNRSVFTLPASPVTITTCGKNFDITPGVTLVQEGNSGNFNATDGLDNDFDGLIDENFTLHYDFNVQYLADPLAITNTLGPTQYINYFTGQGLSDPLIDETGDDVDEVGLTSCDVFAPAGEIPMWDDEEMMLRLSPGRFVLPASYSNGHLTSGEDEDYLYGSGMFTLPAGQHQKVMSAIVYAETAEELESKIKVLKFCKFDVQSAPNLALTSNIGGIYTGNSIPIGWQTSEPDGQVILEYTEDLGGHWQFISAIPAAVGQFDWDISVMPDGALYKLRLRHSYKPDEVILSDQFIINHSGQVAPQVVFTQMHSPFQSVSDSLQIQWIAGDANGDSISISLFISTARDTGWEFLAELPDTGTFKFNTRLYPNTRYAFLKLIADDGISQTEAVSSQFHISNRYPALSDSQYVHLAGGGSGFFKVYVVDSTALTDHQYQLTFNNSGSAKSYDVRDLNLGQTILNNVAQLDSTVMGPAFDGMRLSIHDLEHAIIDTNRTRWSNSAINLDARFEYGSVGIPGIGIVPLTLYPSDYRINFYDHIVDTTHSTFRNIFIQQPSETSFRITNVTTNESIGFFWGHIGPASTSIGVNDILVFVEKDENGVEQLSWRMGFFCDTANAYLPQPGDSLNIITIKPFSSNDRFQFSPGILAVGFDPKTTMPQRFCLYQNFPNPFNPVTTLKYLMPRADRISITVYDILGRKVKDLINGKVEAGIHYVDWDGTNNSNVNAASGLYFAVFKARDIVSVRKMILIR